MTSEVKTRREQTPARQSDDKRAPNERGTQTRSGDRPAASQGGAAGDQRRGEQGRGSGADRQGRGSQGAKNAPAGRQRDRSRTGGQARSEGGNGQGRGNSGNRSRGRGGRGGSGSGRPRPTGGESRRADDAAPAATARPAARVEVPEKPKEIEIPPAISVRDLAQAMQESPIDLIKVLMTYGIMAPITQTIDFDTAAIIGSEFGVEVKPEAAALPEEQPAEQEQAPKTLRLRLLENRPEEGLSVRPPVVAVLGHVDHGKTTLLDAIRKTNVVEGEAGGITQRMGAYQVELAGRKITFLDTPGHEAFTAMRARGAQVTDIVVLVVAADDGVMPQTKEAISHAKAAQVPIIVALNKIDKPNANPDRVKQELADSDLLIEEWGGDVICVPVSAKLKKGIEDLLENVLLVADIDPLLSNPDDPAIGTVIESEQDPRRGVIATLLIQNGTLHVGDPIVSGGISGRVRAMFDDKGNPVDNAPPSMPVRILGLPSVPTSGDTFKAVADASTARTQAAAWQAEHQSGTAAPVKLVSLEDVFQRMQAGQVKELNLIVKADFQGSLEPIVNSLNQLNGDEVKVKILLRGTGNISESDISLAAASDAIVIGFNVQADAAAQNVADSQGVDIRTYSVIYNLIEDVELALKGMLEPVYKEVALGEVEVRQVFKLSKHGRVAGCMVRSGMVTRGSLIRVHRADEVIATTRVSSLKRFQEDAAEVKAGFECGMTLEKFDDYQVGDVFEAYRMERVR